MDPLNTVIKKESKLEQLKNDLIIIIQYTQKNKATYPLSEWMDGRLCAYQQVMELINELES